MKIASCTVFMAALCVLFGAEFLDAQIKIADGMFLDGYIRYRSEWDGKDFESSTDMQSYSTMRTRIGLKAVDLVENTTVYLLIGDSRTLGHADPYLSGGHIGPNELDNNIGAVKAYLEIRDFFHPHLTLKLGRMENNMGRSRFFGPGNWNVYGPRTHDGFSLKYSTDAASIRLFNFWGYGGDRYWATPQEESDHKLIGLDARFLNEDLQFLLLRDVDDRPVTMFNGNRIDKTLDQYTLLTHFRYTARERWSLFGDAAWQFGKRGLFHGNADVNAYMIAAEVKYNFDMQHKPWIGAGFDITSGDDSPYSGFNKSTFFRADYHSKHSYQGIMDYFECVDSNYPGIENLFIKFGFSPVESANVQIDLHRFTAQRTIYGIESWPNGNSFGYELDTRTTVSLRQGLGMQYGLSAFWASDEWQGPDADTALFSYISIVCRF